MPVITGGYLLDMGAFGRDEFVAFRQTGQLLSATQTRVEILGYDAIGYEIRLVFTGSNLGALTATGFPTTGLITGLQVEQGGDVIFSIDGLSIQASALNTALSDIDSAALWNLVYGGADTITGGDTWGRANTLSGHGGNDTIFGGTGGDDLRGGAGDDIIFGGDETDPTSITYGDGIDGGDGDDSLYGGAGRDVIVGGDGRDLIEGGDGADILYHDGDGLAATESFVTLRGDFGSSYTLPVRTFLAGDRRAEDSAADTINGGAGDDFIYLGVGDSADGGAGNDTVELNFRGRNGALILDMSAGAASALSAASGGTFADVERFDVVGSLFNDVIVGGADGSILYGEAGEDTVDGGAGNDSVTGSAFTNSSRIGNVWGSRFDDGQRDVLFGGEGNDTVSVGWLDVADGGAGTDALFVTLDGMNTGVTLDLTTGDRFAALAAITGGSYTNFETISGLHMTEHGDVVRSLGVASIFTFAGDDTVYADDLANMIGLGDGDDTAYAMGGNDLLFGGFGDDQLYGGAGTDTIYADVDYDPGQAVGSGADFIDGGDGNDSLFGGAGDDVIVGGAGGDRIFGEAGHDTVSYAGSSTGVSITRYPDGFDPVTFEQAYSYVVSGGDAQGDLLTSIEAVLGSGFGDSITGVQQADGGGGDDSITGADSADLLFGGAGDDALAGLGGDDTLDGGAGMDIASYSRHFASAPIGQGVTVDLRIQGGPQSTGAAGSDTLISIEGVVGSINADILHGDDQANYIQGALDGSQPGSGPFQGDQLFGHGGDDVIIGDGAADGLGYTPGDGVNRGYDLISGGDGDDVITAGNGADVVNGDAGDDVIHGEWDSDSLDGGDGDDIVDGGSLNDTIHGGSGNDRLIGGAGNDAINGGDGLDTAVFAGARAAYAFTVLPNGALQVIGPDGTDLVTGVERFQFADGLFDITGAPVTPGIDGGEGPDTLTGDGDGNRISGYGGDDILNGGDGDDVLDGGLGNDLLNGGAGIDTVTFATATTGARVQLARTADQPTGGGARDTIIGVENLTGSAFDDDFSGDENDNVLMDALGGDDRFIGGAGNDTLVIERSGGGAATTSLLRGGLGDDAMSFDGHGRYADTVAFEGQDGDDVISAAGAFKANINAGGGNDRVTVDTLGGSFVVKLGSGADTLVLSATGGAFAGSTADLVRDFAAGNGGDVLDLTAYLSGGALINFTAGSNPFLSGHMRLVQSGADTLVQVDRNGGGDSFVTVVTLQKTLTSSFTAFNFNGLAPLPAAVEGGAGADGLNGTGGIDVLNGNGGDDVLTGGAGNDVLNGGAASDVLDGGAGDDVLNGGSGAQGDTATYASATAGVNVNLGIVGNQQDTGGAGVDSLTGIEHLVGSAFTDGLRGDGFANRLTDTLGGNDFLRGEAGDDTILIARSGGGAATTVRLNGGDGVDALTFTGNGRYSDTVTLEGEGGNDVITVSGAGTVGIDAGAGNDTVIYDTLDGAYRITLGEGSDTVRLASTGGQFAASGDNLVRDFATGPGGDIVDLSAWLAGGALTNYSGGNPFADGHMRLIQSGSRTLLQVDRDGGGNGYQTVLAFTNTTAAAFTAANFGGFDPAGLAPMPVEAADKAFDAGPQVSPILADDFLVLPGEVKAAFDEPLVLPGAGIDGLRGPTGVFAFADSLPFALMTVHDRDHLPGGARDHGQDDGF